MHKTQEKIINFLHYRNLDDLSLREIGALIEENSAQKIKHHLSRLEQQGLISWDRKHRKIKLMTYASTSEKSKGLIPIPILGYADCGPATMFAEQNIEGYLRVSKKLLKKTSNIFAVQARGDSLNRALIGGKNIENGDYVLIDKDANDLKDDDIVLSIIDGLANIKKIKFDSLNQQISLRSQSTKHFPPIIIKSNELSEYLVNGKAVQVIKNQQ